MTTHMPNGKMLLTLCVLCVLNIMVTDVDAHSNRVLKIRFGGCGCPPHVRNALIKQPSTRTVGSTQTYSCDDGYLSNPAYVNMDITCTSGLVWTNPLFTCDAPEIINLALNKPASQSATHGVFSAGLAVDGDKNGDFDAGTCTHTPSEYRPYWEVDLGDVYRIYNVTVFNRKDCCNDRLSNFKVSTTDHYNGLWDITGVFDGAVGDSHTFQIGTNIFGRFVKIQLLSTNHLTLCEVEVFGESEPVRFDFVPGRVGTAIITNTTTETSNIDCIANCRISWCSGVNFYPDDGTCEQLSDVTSIATTESIQFYTNPVMK